MLRILSLLVFIITSPFVLAGSYSVEISESDLQDSLPVMLPFEQKTFYEAVVITGSDVGLVEKNDKIDATITIEATLPGDIKGTGQGRISSAIRYDAAQGSFYLNKIYLTEFEVEEALANKKQSIKDATQLAVNNGLSSKPVYIISDDAKKQQLAKAIIESIKVADGKLVVIFSAP